jgi:hypothetical protein
MNNEDSDIGRNKKDLRTGRNNEDSGIKAGIKRDPKQECKLEHWLVRHW